MFLAAFTSAAGLPSWFDMDTSAARWAEEAGYDIAYASSLDLHEGRVDASRYSVIVFPGHDEYWSKKVRDATEEALAAGTHLAVLGASNIYFHIRIEGSEDDRAGRRNAGGRSARRIAKQSTVCWAYSTTA